MKLKKGKITLFTIKLFLLFTIYGCSYIADSVLGKSENAPEEPIIIVSNFDFTYYPLLNQNSIDFRWNYSSEYIEFKIDVWEGDKSNAITYPASQVLSITTTATRYVVSNLEDNKQYTYQVTANSTASTNQSDYFTHTTLATPVTDLLLDTKDGYINVSWEFQGVNRNNLLYRIYIFDEVSNLYTTVVSSTSYNSPNLQKGVYRVMVTSINSENFENLLTIEGSNYIKNYSHKPFGIIEIDNDHTIVDTSNATIVWTSIAATLDYNIYLSSEGESTQVYTSKSTSITLTNLLDNKLYSVSIYASVLSNGEIIATAISNPATFVTLANRVENISLSSDITDINLNWDYQGLNSNNATLTYKIQLYDQSNILYRSLISSSNSTLIQYVQEGTYRILITSINQNSNENTSVFENINQVSYYHQHSFPLTTLTIASKSATNLTISWNADKNINEYEIVLFDTKGGTNIKIITQSSSLALLDNLYDNQLYSIKMRPTANNLNYTGEYSTSIDSYTLANRPSNISLETNPGSFELKWDFSTSSPITTNPTFIISVYDDYNNLIIQNATTEYAYILNNNLEIGLYSFIVTTLNASNEENTSSTLNENYISYSLQTNDSYFLFGLIEIDQNTITVNSSQVNLNWTKTHFVVDYNIYLSSEGESTQVYTSKSTSITLTNLLDNKLYSVSIYASVLSNGEIIATAISNPATFVTLANRVENISLSSDITDINLNWDYQGLNSNNATLTYKIQLYDQSNILYRSLISSSNSTLIQYVQEGTYRILITSINQNSNENTSVFENINQVSYYHQHSFPLTTLTIASKSATNLTISWNADKNINEYEIVLFDTKGGTNIKIITQSSSLALLDNLYDNQLYSIKIRPTTNNLNYAGEYSTSIDSYTLANRPSNISLETNPGSFELKWDFFTSSPITTNPTFIISVYDDYNNLIIQNATTEYAYALNNNLKVGLYSFIVTTLNASNEENTSSILNENYISYLHTSISGSEYSFAPNHIYQIKYEYTNNGCTGTIYNYYTVEASITNITEYGNIQLDTDDNCIINENYFAYTDYSSALISISPYQNLNLTQWKDVFLTDTTNLLYNCEALEEEVDEFSLQCVLSIVSTVQTKSALKLTWKNITADTNLIDSITNKISCSTANATKEVINTHILFPDTATGTNEVYRFAFQDDCGEDGEFQINPIDLTFMPENYILDNNTQLSWDSTTTLLSYTKSILSCQNNTKATKTWRLANFFELITILNYQSSYLPDDFYISQSGSLNINLWVEDNNNKTNLNWYYQISLNNNNGFSINYLTDNSEEQNYLCVSGTKLVSDSAYIENDISNLNIVDKRTDLMWENYQETNTNSNLSLTLAYSYCNTLNQNGYSNWRIPSIKELSTLIDLNQNTGYKESMPSIFSNFDTLTSLIENTDSTQRLYFWSSSYSVQSDYDIDSSTTLTQGLPYVIDFNSESLIVTTIAANSANIICVRDTHK